MQQHFNNKDKQHLIHSDINVLIMHLYHNPIAGGCFFVYILALLNCNLLYKWETQPASFMEKVEKYSPQLTAIIRTTISITR